MISLIYNLLLLLCLPGVFLYYLWRIFISRKSNKSWRENLGELPKFAMRRQGRKAIWVHAASVGEIIASIPLLNALRPLRSDDLILVTTITQTGNEVARKSAKAADEISYFPLDYPFIVARALNRVRPDVFVMVETEIWPNFLAAAKRRGIPTVLVNGRISDRSFKRGMRWRWLLSWAIKNIDYCCMQSDTDAKRILALGARHESVRVIGNMKFDQDGTEMPEKEVIKLRGNLGIPEDVPVIVAGSTNPGEEKTVLEAYALLKQNLPNLKLIIAPRQIDRANEIESLVISQGFSCAKRTAGSTEGFDVLILDTFGELAAVYSVANVTFVGGSLIPKGGHSIFQPILQGKPVIFGPYMQNFRDISQLAISSGVGFEVRSAKEFAERAMALFADSERLAKISEICRKLVADNRGASERCAELIAALVGGCCEV
ncbi:MAG: 3-deoxy-D-manno-octulosonic acid transferase [Armatimonadota bacterium]|nr:3-deoxy-D-manno-octulosonic acid transferase [Armatimonadota bacterium]